MGITQHLVDKYYPVEATMSESAHRSNSKISFTNAHLLGAYIILGIGGLMSLLGFMVELFAARNNRKDNVQVAWEEVDLEVA